MALLDMKIDPDGAVCELPFQKICCKIGVLGDCSVILGEFQEKYRGKTQVGV
ncbi:MAG: hypothetical protein IJZ85_11040 [Lachnospiraceae bacterium]|nr:hypothetical protein [Lachnospiraceae bacterium]